MQEPPLVALARDFSGNDPAIVDRARHFAAQAPTEPETIGFYGLEEAPEPVRAFLATVCALEDAGHIQGIEDKYTYELLWQWRESGVVDPPRLPETARAIFGALMDPWDYDLVDTDAFRERLWHGYGQATRELEDHIAARGRTLLSLDATAGDTLFFALVEPPVAERWRGTTFGTHAGYQTGVRAPVWDRFWEHLSYAGGDILRKSSHEAIHPARGCESRLQRGSRSGPGLSRRFRDPAPHGWRIGAALVVRGGR